MSENDRSPSAEDGHRESNPRLSRGEWRSLEGWSPLFEALVALSAVLTLLTTAYQGCLTRSALELTRQSVRDARVGGEADRESAQRAGEEVKRSNQAMEHLVLQSNDLTQRSVELAERSLRLSVENFVAAERPWVAVVEVASDETYFEVGKPGAVAVNIRNAGRGPALDVSTCIHLGTSLQYLDDYPACAGSPTGGGGPIILVPDMFWTVTTQTGETLARKEIEELNTGAVQVFAYGWVEYKDAFGFVHVTEFCIRRDVTGLWRPCAEGNRAN